MQVTRDYLRMAFDRVPIAADRRSALTRRLHQALRVPARWRLDHGMYGLPFELWIKNAATRAFDAPKPKVDAQQLQSKPATC